MPAHTSHDWSETGYCFACTEHVLSPLAQMQCRPSTDDAPREAAPQIDWLNLNREFGG